MMYMHVPFAWTSFLMTVLGALAAGIYLWKKENDWERTSRAIIEVAAVSAFLTLMTGSVWGKITWGTWWVWTLHQGSTIFRQEGPPKIDSDMFVILLTCFGVVLWWAFSCVKLRLSGSKNG